MKEKKLVYGVGINDADYPIQIVKRFGKTGEGKVIQKRVWSCPYQDRWRDMIRRCYSEAELIKHPNYLPCSVSNHWLYFMTFRKWMLDQDWQGKHLDKDLLIPNNEVYSEEACCFIDQKVNLFILDKNSAKTDLPIGVSHCTRKGKPAFRARCTEVLTGENKYLGMFDDKYEAHEAWLTFKLEQAKILASQQTDQRVADALVDRYENFDKYFGKSK